MRVNDRALQDFLLVNGLVSRAQLADVADNAAGEALYDALAARGVVSQDELRRAAAHLSGVPFVAISPHDIDFETLSLIPEPVARARSAVAYRREGNTVEVALLDLSDLEHLGFLRERHGLTVLPRLTASDSLKQALHIYQKKLKEQFKSLVQHSAHAVEALLRHALLSNASAVHLDPLDTGLLVRYRIEDALHEAMRLPGEAMHLLGRLKDAAGLSHTLHLPQEGTFRAEFAGEAASVRVHSIPTHGGERLTLHIASERSPRRGFTLESLGFHGKALEDMHRALKAREGLILIAGPAGSGVTTTLYALLDMLGERRTLIATVEERIEYALPHAMQTVVRPELGLGAEAALRAVLKHDPGIVMLGAVADEKTASLAAHAASRGMLVLAGIAASSAAGAVRQMRDFGVPAAVLASILRASASVRAPKRLCPHKREDYKLARVDNIPLEAASFDGRDGADFGRALAALKDEGVVGRDMQWKDLLFSRAADCSECEGGYRGRVGLQEALPISAYIKELVRQDAETPALDRAARKEGMLSMTEDGLFKAAQGLTSVEEIAREAQR
ncbi:MAG TPA: ATPase, T2SS/T4P/T4SS family [Candidatus Paceibacterota bacterium]|nr:ATPase, T2SS/T4P/T4SS family [Candidatus Paceibacterota bacterium]